MVHLQLPHRHHHAGAHLAVAALPLPGLQVSDPVGSADHRVLCCAALVAPLIALLCVLQLQGDVLAEQEAQDEEGDDVGEEDPRGVRQAGAHQVSGNVFFSLRNNFFFFMIGMQTRLASPSLTSFLRVLCLSYPEVITGVFFVLMTLLWFTREPGFVPGWTSLFEK